MKGGRLSRAAWMLRDYADMLDQFCRDEKDELVGGADCQANIDDALSLADEFTEGARRKMVISE